MSAQTDARQAPIEDPGVIAWRVEQLLAAGFDGRVAVKLAHDRSIDLHDLLDLVARGCPPPLAARILAP